MQNYKGCLAGVLVLTMTKLATKVSSLERKTECVEYGATFHAFLNCSQHHQLIAVQQAYLDMVDADCNLIRDPPSLCAGGTPWMTEDIRVAVNAQQAVHVFYTSPSSFDCPSSHNYTIEFACLNNTKLEFQSPLFPLRTDSSVFTGSIIHLLSANDQDGFDLTWRGSADLGDHHCSVELPSNTELRVDIWDLSYLDYSGHPEAPYCLYINDVELACATVGRLRTTDVWCATNDVTAILTFRPKYPRLSVRFWIVLTAYMRDEAATIMVRCGRSVQGPPPLESSHLSPAEASSSAISVHCSSTGSWMGPVLGTLLALAILAVVLVVVVIIKKRSKWNLSVDNSTKMDRSSDAPPQSSLNVCKLQGAHHRDMPLSHQTEPSQRPLPEPPADDGVPRPHQCGADPVLFSISNDSKGCRPLASNLASHHKQIVDNSEPVYARDDFVYDHIDDMHNNPTTTSSNMSSPEDRQIIYKTNASGVYIELNNDGQEGLYGEIMALEEETEIVENELYC